MARPRKEDRPAYTREVLAAIAMQVFEERGYEATRMEHIANAANIGKSSLYHHVSGKEELLRIALEQASNVMFEALERAEAKEGPALDRLVFILRALVLTELKHLAAAKVLFDVKIGPLGNTATEQYIVGARRQFLDAVVQVTREAQIDGDLDGSVDAGLLARLLVGAANSPVDWFRADGRWSPNLIADLVTQMVAPWIIVAAEVPTGQGRRRNAEKEIVGRDLDL